MRHGPTIVVCLALAVSCACSGEPGPDSAGSEATGAGSPGPRVTTDVVYGHKDGLALSFDVFEPIEGNGAGVISIVSAGWRSSWETMQQFVEAPDGTLRPMTMDEIIEVGSYLPAHNYLGLLDAGFTVFSVRHGTSPRYAMPDIVADMRQAVRFIRHHAADYGVDPERIGVWGGSAGGHLSLLLATTAEPGVEGADDFLQESTRVAAAVAYFPPTDLERWGTPQIRSQFPAVDLDTESAGLYSPLRFASPDDAPSLILHGDADALVPIEEGESMYEALVAAGAVSEFVPVEGSDHGFYDEDAVMANRRMVEWFSTHLN